MATLQGQAEMRRKLARLAANMPREVGRALRIEAELISTAAKRQTPVATGALRSSIHATGPERKGNEVSAAIVAGGPSAGYAIHVHEDLEAFHPVGNAKFIERPLMEAVSDMPRRIAQRLNLEGVIK